MEKEKEEVQQPKKRPFRRTTYRGVDLTDLLDMPVDKLIKLFRSRQRRRFAHGVPGKYYRLMKKLRKAKNEAIYGEKPKGVKTHFRNCIIMPEMVHSVVEIYNGKTFNSVEIKPGKRI